MKAANGTVVSVQYTLTSDSGEVLDSSEGREPLSYLHGYGNIIPGLEKALEGAEPGLRTTVRVSAEEGYGDKNPEAVFEVPREQFPDDMELAQGMQVAAEGPEGPIVFTVKELTENGALLDGNHPLAGMDLNFDVEVVDVREASEEELAHGHVHHEGHSHG